MKKVCLPFIVFLLTCNFVFAQNDEIEFRDEVITQEQLVNSLFPKNNRSISRDFGIAPNPTATEFDLTIIADEDEPLNWMLIDVSAHIVKRGTTTLKEGQNVFAITVNDLPRGVYVLRVEIKKKFLNKRLMVW